MMQQAATKSAQAVQDYILNTASAIITAETVVQISAIDVDVTLETRSAENPFVDTLKVCSIAESFFQFCLSF
jgi:hypothetical protein